MPVGFVTVQSLWSVLNYPVAFPMNPFKGETCWGSQLGPRGGTATNMWGRSISSQFITGAPPIFYITIRSASHWRQPAGDVLGTRLYSMVSNHAFNIFEPVPHSLDWFNYPPAFKGGWGGKNWNISKRGGWSPPHLEIVQLKISGL